MEIDDLTIGEAKELAQMFGNKEYDDNPYKVGKNYFIRTVTMALVGTLKSVGRQELVLEDAAWVADTGRFGDFLRDGDADEVEPFPNGEVFVGRGAIIDVVEWKHKPLRKQK